MITVDTETVGLHGLIVLLQYAEDDGPINLHCPWTEPVFETLQLIEKIASQPVLGFNLAFDWFHIYKMWTMWKLLAEIDANAIPEDYLINDQRMLIDLEKSARDYPLCLKPKSACDLFLHARKGPYQSLMDRKNITIRKIPSSIAYLLAEELEERIPFKDIYFARRKVKGPRWQVDDRKDTFGDVDPDWKNITVRFRSSSALKALAVDALNVPYDEILKFGDISPKLHPVEFGYAPYAEAAMRIRLKNKSKERRRVREFRNTWPDYIKMHITHWGYNELARKYAENDVVYTRALYPFFGSPEFGDDDSELACMVGAARWRGYRVNLDGLKNLKANAHERRFYNGEPIPYAPREVKAWIMEVCDPTEKLAISRDDTKKVTLKRLSEDWKLPCEFCKDGSGCKQCNKKGWVPHPAAKRAELVLDRRKSDKEEELYDKLLAADRLHASFKVIGSLSSRMSGTDGLNALAIKSATSVKEQFFFAWGDDKLCGGDFASFEVTIAEAEYNDVNLRKDLLTCEACNGSMIFNQKIRDYECQNCGKHKGKKIHAMFGTYVFPPMTYEEIAATDGKPDDKYTPSKQSVFLLIYGGEGYTMQDRLGVSQDVADEACRKFKRRYIGIERAQNRVKDKFESMRQPNGRGTKVEWHEPSDYIETLFGFRRYFTLENRICKEIFNLANKMPAKFRNVKIKVTRTDREQWAGGAAMSALFSSAFTVQSHNKRAAINHVIQGSGAQITKRVQRRIWDLQPVGIHKWLVQPMNIHDSIMVPVDKDNVEKVKIVVSDTVEEFRPKIPLIKLPWKSGMKHWADKR